MFQLPILINASNCLTPAMSNCLLTTGSTGSLFYQQQCVTPTILCSQAPVAAYGYQLPLNSVRLPALQYATLPPPPNNFCYVQSTLAPLVLPVAVEAKKEEKEEKEEKAAEERSSSDCYCCCVPTCYAPAPCPPAIQVVAVPQVVETRTSHEHEHKHSHEFHHFHHESPRKEMCEEDKKKETEAVVEKETCLTLDEKIRRIRAELNLPDERQQDRLCKQLHEYEERYKKEFCSPPSPSSPKKEVYL